MAVVDIHTQLTAVVVKIARGDDNPNKLTHFGGRGDQLSLVRCDKKIQVAQTLDGELVGLCDHLSSLLVGDLGRTDAEVIDKY
jgi:hypothetical protein